jgi:tetratricopeptide (TPR) repeat protein
MKKDIAKLHFQHALYAFAQNGTPASTTAKEALRQAVALDLGTPLYGYYLALCDLAAGQCDACIAAVHRLMPQLDAKMQFHAKYHLGIAWLAKNEPEKAEPLLKEVLAAAGSVGLNLDVHFPLAVVYAKAGRWTEAVNILNPTLGTSA